MPGTRILITNNSLAERAGTELYVRDVAVALQARGHRPIAYSTEVGDVACDLRRAGVPVIDDLHQLGEPPQLIHAQHHLDAMTALVRFPDVPAVFVCHGWMPWQERPPRFPSIRRYVAVDEACRDRLVVEHGIAAERVSVLPNFVDPNRFPSRPALPNRPQRALLFCNQASTANMVPLVRSACDSMNLPLDVWGRESGCVVERPEAHLGQYDLVFARGRSALEALAVGCAVIVCGVEGAGPLVTTAGVDRLRRNNFGLRTFSEPLNEAMLVRQIQRFDAADAAAVSAQIRCQAGLPDAIDALERIYEQALSEPPEHDPLTERHAASDYLRGLAAKLKQFDVQAHECSQARLEAKRRHDECAQLHDHYGGLLSDLHRAETDAARWKAECDRLRVTIDAAARPRWWNRRAA